MSAMYEGNPAPLSGFMMAGKPTLCSTQPIRTWSHTLVAEKGVLQSLTILKNDTPYWIYHASKAPEDATRNAMVHLFDLASGISKELPAQEVKEFLVMIREVSFELLNTT